MGKDDLFPLLFLFIANTICAASLELYADEAYYVQFSKHLNWGYFDHPPMVGWLIWLGTFLLPGELGVRFVFILMTTGFYWLLYSIVNPSNKKLFWLVAFGLFPLQLMGFMALPDIPLLFFTLLFFIGYKRFLSNPSWINIILISMYTAGLLYSKYHGGLIILFTLFSNPFLFREKRFYPVIFLSMGLYFPHLLWLNHHDFISITYHLFHRESKGFSIFQTPEYILGFLFFNGPFLFIPLFVKSLKGRIMDYFERALFFNLIGFFLFFLLMSFRGRIEANWTIPVLVPVMILGFNKLKDNNFNLQLAYSGILLFVVLRVVLIFPIGKGNRFYEFHGHQEFAEQVKAKSNELSVVTNRYQEASLLSFYLKEFIPAMNVNSRPNQYDLWEEREEFWGREVMFLKRDPEGDIQHPYFGNYRLEKTILSKPGN